MRPPEGFTVLRRGGRRVMVRDDVSAWLAPWLLRDRIERPADATAFGDGRGGAYRFVLGDRSLVFREYRRGGWVARWVGAHYAGLRPRPFRELVVTEAVRRRGLATVEVLGARVAGAGVYRGALVTAELPNVVPILTALEAAADAAGRRSLVREAGRTVGEMHRLGLRHRDLNCGNLLAQPDAGTVYVIDLDRAALGAEPVGPRARRRALHRLARSLRKLDPSQRLVSSELRQAFAEGYGESDGSRCVC